MTIKKILAAAATATVLSVVGASGASADSWYGGDGYGYQDNRGDYNDNYRGSYDRDGDHDGDRDWRGYDRDHHQYWDHDGYRGWRYRHAHYYGRPFWYHGRYVVRSYDRFGRVSFIEVGPYSSVNGYFRF
jgi:hypothetical protein